jgi:hypothetical protein
MDVAELQSHWYSKRQLRGTPQKQHVAAPEAALDTRHAQLVRRGARSTHRGPHAAPRAGS